MNAYKILSFSINFCVMLSTVSKRILEKYVKFGEIKVIKKETGILM